MLVDILNKILMLLFFGACLNSTRHAYYFIQTLVTSKDDDQSKYRLTNKSLFLLGISMAYILTVIFTGIKL